MSDARFPFAGLTGPIDCDIHPGMVSLAELFPHLEGRWVDHLQAYGVHLRQTFANTMTYPRLARDTARSDAWPPGGKPPGSDLDFLREQHLDAQNIAYGILQPLRPGVASERNLSFAAALARAVNSWQVEKWFKPEPRLKGSIVVAPDDADAAIAEIEHWAGHPGFVQVALPPKSLEPLGRKRYWPIFEAAAKAGLPIGIHVSGVAGHAITASGWPSFYAEDHNSNIAAIQATAISLIFEGVTTRWPDLRFVLIEGGLGWSTALAARLDRTWVRFSSELAHLIEAPSIHLKRSFHFTTQPIEEPDRKGMLTEMLREVGIERILFASDYPHWDYDDPRYAIPGDLTSVERQAILRNNAAALYGLKL